MGIHLKSTLRQPVRTLLLLLLIGLISFAFIARAVEYIVISREITRLGGYYRSIGSLEAMDSDSAPMEEAMALVADCPYITLTDPRRYVSGLLPNGQISADSYALTSDQTGEEPKGIFVTDILAYGELLEIYHSEYTGWWHLSLKVDDILEGRPENVALGEVLSLTILPDTVPEGLDPVAGMEKGRRYFIRACADRGFAYATRMEDGRVGYLRMKPLNPGGNLWFLPVEPGAYIDLEAPELASMKAELAVLRQNLRTLQVIGTKDMTSLPQIQTAAREYTILEGRGIELQDYENGNPVCVVSAGYAIHAGLEVGDTLKLTLRDNQGPYGYISTLTEGWQDWASLPTRDVALEIVGIFDRQQMVGTYYYYQVHEVYIPLSVLPEGFGREGSADINSGSFSFVLGSTQDQQAFQSSLRLPLAALGYEAYFVEHHGDNFWLTAEPMVQSAAFNAVVFILVLTFTLMLCAFLYLRQRRRDFAIQRALGRPGGVAIREMLTPMVWIGLLSTLMGGVAAWRYALQKAGEMLSALSGPQGVEATAALSPLWLGLLCGGVLALLLLVLTVGTAVAVRRPVLELLQDGAARKAEPYVHLPDLTDSAHTPIEMKGITTASPMRVAGGGKQSAAGAVRYVLRHARRSRVRSGLCIVTALGFVLALGWMNATLESSMAEVDRLYNTTQIKAEFVPSVRGGKGSGEVLVKKLIVDAVLATGIIRDHFIEGTILFRVTAPIAPPEQKESYPFDNNRLESRLCPTFFVDDMEKFLSNRDPWVDAHRTYLAGWDDSFLVGDYPERQWEHAPIAVSRQFLDEGNFALGDVLYLTSFTFVPSPRALVTAPEEYTCMGFQIIGVFENEAYFFAAPRACLTRLHSMYHVYTTASFDIDPLKNREIPAIREALKVDAPWYNSDFKVSVRLEIFDEELRQAVAPLESNIALMAVLYPVTLAVSVLIGAGLALLLTLQSAREAAIMRVLGITKLWVRAQLTAEQLLLCIIGLSLGMVGLALMTRQVGLDALLCAALYLLGTAAGAIVSGIMVSNRAALELLQVKE